MCLLWVVQRNLYWAAGNSSGGRSGPRFLIVLEAMVFNSSGGRGGRAGFLEKFGFFYFLGPAPVLGVLDIALLIPEVWWFYLLSNAIFFHHKTYYFQYVSLLSSPGHSPSSPNAPPDRKKNQKNMIFECFMYFSYKLPLDPINRPWDPVRSIAFEKSFILHLSRAS